MTASSASGASSAAGASSSSGSGASSVVASAKKAIIAAIGTIVLPELTNIQNALNTIAANQGNVAIAVQQYGVILANLQQVLIVAPAIVPLLEQDVLTAGSNTAAGFVGEIIAEIKAAAGTSAKSA